MTVRVAAMENVYFLRPALTWEQRCAGIAAAGFHSVYAVPYPLRDDDFPRLRNLGDAPARHGLRVSALYANLDLAEPPDAPGAVRLRRLFEETEGTPRIELSVKCSTPIEWTRPLENVVRAAVLPLWEIAARRGLALALYPHSFYPLESLAQTRSVLALFGKPGPGFVFPLSHVFAVQPFERALAELAACAAEVASVNVCGCRRAGTVPSKSQHVPLDEGDAPFAAVAGVLRVSGFTGDVIVQGHGWSGDPDGYLRRSRAAVREHLHV